MTSYLIKKTTIETKVKSMNMDNSYKLVPKDNMRYGYLRINKITIVDQRFIDALISSKIDLRYKKLVMIAYSILNAEADESTEGDVMITLDEVAKLREKILKKYNKILSQEKEEKYLKMLRIIENELRAKIIEYKMNMDNYYEEEETRRSGR